MARREQFGVNELTFVLLRDTTGDILHSAGLVVPVDGTAGYAKGALFIKTDAGAGVQGAYINVGTRLVSDFDLVGAAATALAANLLQVDKVSLSAGDICTATTIKTLVAAPAAGYYLEFISATLTFKYGGAAYGAGGNLTIGLVGGAALSGLVSAANSLGAGADKIVQFVPLAVTAQALVKETALGLQTSGQFTLGAATGTAEVTIAYRVLPIET